MAPVLYGFNKGDAAKLLAFASRLVYADALSSRSLMLTTTSAIANAKA